MIGRVTSFLPLRWLAVLLLSLLSATMGSAVALAERSDFDRCAVAAKSAGIDVKALDFSTAPNKAVFYSGSGNRARALNFADNTGATPIDLTLGGQYLNSLDLYSKLPAAEADAIWAQASQAYATGASGKIKLFIKGARPDRVFNTIERPLIEANPNIFQQTLHY
jgi:hypothetical protein